METPKKVDFVVKSYTVYEPKNGGMQGQNWTICSMQGGEWVSPSVVTNCLLFP